mmetsp:Transcript_30114/g.50009  ORF Transcript_30114/g.50009 Transcript_30114/m.50009 type:complete len:205 (-) Transcript_30114:7-621(-)
MAEPLNLLSPLLVITTLILTGFLAILFNVLGNHFFSLVCPFTAILQGVVQILITRHSKHTTLLELLGQRNNVVVKEPKLSCIPSSLGVKWKSTLLVGMDHLCKETFIPLPVDMPVLHSMRDIACLNQVLHDNSGLAIDSILCRFLCSSIVPRFGKGLLPPVLSNCLELFIKNIRGKDIVDNNLPEALQFRRSAIDAAAQVCETG